MRRRFSCAALAAAAFFAPYRCDADGTDNDREPAAPLNEHVIKAPGDPLRPVTLLATVFSPPGTGPFPLAVVNHGASGRPDESARYRQSFSIDYFLSRGFAVVAPMMRGFGGSGGTPEIDGCDLARMAQQNARDILAVVAYMVHEPAVDASRVVVAGQSFGGWNSLGVGSIATSNILGLISFEGGVTTSACPVADRGMLDGAERLGRTTRIPSLWIYAENDALFPERIWRPNYMRYTAAGARATLVDVGVLADAHNLLGHGEWLGLWVPATDAFLASIGLPHEARFPEYLPTPAPASTNYAVIGDFAAVPFLNETHAGFYRLFLEKPFPRALVVSPVSASMQSGGFDPIRRALEQCRKGGPPCQLYAVDDRVVWTGPPEGGSAKIKGVSIFTRGVAAGGRVGLQRLLNLTPQCTVRTIPTPEVTQAPAHGRVSVSGPLPVASFAADSPYAACNPARARLVQVDYDADVDFTGVDFIGIGVFDPDQPPRREKFAVSVSKK